MMKKLIVLLLGFQMQVFATDYNILDFGAKADDHTVNTEYIQNAIDTCAKNGGGTVLIADGIYISGTIILKDNVTLHIAENASLLGSKNPLDYKSIDTFIDATGQERGNCLVGAVDAINISIEGKGIIDGNGKAFTKEYLQQTKKELSIDTANQANFGNNRPFLIRFVRSENIRLTNITLRQAAAWACHFYQSKKIAVDAISIFNHANKNNDGIDIDSSSDITITNCNIDAADDAICVKTTSPKPSYNINISNCKLKSDWGALKFGTESMGDFYNVTIKHCEIYDTKGGGIKLLSVDGAAMRDVFIDSITMTNVDMPIFVRLGERLRTYRDAEQQQVGSISNINIKNITASTRSVNESRVNPPSGIFITGTSNHKIESISLENISVNVPGNPDNIPVTTVEEQEKNYPEFSFFKALPAYGLYGRHIDTLKMKNVTFSVIQKDTRKKIVLEDVTKK